MNQEYKACGSSVPSLRECPVCHAAVSYYAVEAHSRWHEEQDKKVRQAAIGIGFGA